MKISLSFVYISLEKKGYFEIKLQTDSILNIEVYFLQENISQILQINSINNLTLKFEKYILYE